MNRVMQRAKLHRFTVGEACLHCEGSSGIDERSLDATDMQEFERIEFYNGERFATYIIKARRGLGATSLNGAVVRKAQMGDLLIICTYAPPAERKWRGGNFTSCSLAKVVCSSNSVSAEKRVPVRHSKNA